MSFEVNVKNALMNLGIDMDEQAAQSLAEKIANAGLKFQDFKDGYVREQDVDILSEHLGERVRAASCGPGPLHVP